MSSPEQPIDETVGETTSEDYDAVIRAMQADGHNIEDADQPEEPETFPRSYVEELRHENGRYRQRAQQADDLAARLHTELVRATGRLADPTDLPFNPDHIDDTDAMSTAIDELLAAKPHLASRRPIGDVGQGHRGAPVEPVSLLGLLKERA